MPARVYLATNCLWRVVALNLPAVPVKSSPAEHYQTYLSALENSLFSGDIEYSYGSRLAVATDNSVYQKLPQAVVFPKGIDDLRCLGELSNQHPLVKFSARGGGTGTNGQSLTDGIVVDISRHMNQVLEINAEEGWVRVQAGVVKDALNDALRPFGFFFAPDLSTSNRATVGGMISTDASGQGSLVYGKTSDHVLGLTAVMANGELLETTPMPVAQAQERAKQTDTLGKILAQVLDTCMGKREQILAKFPRMNRFLTGYDLEHAYDEENQLIDLSRIIAGSEGSLVMLAEAKLSITPISKNVALVNIKYDSFESALRHAPRMIAAKATSVETVDSRVLNLAREDIIWHSIADLITDVPGKDMLGLNMVEYNSNDLDEINERIGRLEEELTQAAATGDCGVIGYQVTFSRAEINKIYAMRKKSVGLLGKTKGAKKPLAFAEDTGVPPENLADYIMEFRALLDSHGLQYGMFGHVDAGVLHVRPALDLCDPEQEKLMHQISDEVVQLVAKYGGLMWGEHGKGYRSEYSPAFFGDVLYNELRRIKGVFDPANKMNPGKICTPLDSADELVKISDVKRATFDRTIPIAFKQAFQPALDCNGNGLCFNYDTKSPMCPSSKITSDRRHSPKGRAGLVREWLRLLTEQGVNTTELKASSFKTSFLQRWKNSRNSKDDFSHEVLDAMNGCLACKSCSSQCPVSVDVPSFRSTFLSIYYQRYMRPAKDILVANVEALMPLFGLMPKTVNFFLRQTWLKKFMAKYAGYVDMPLLSVPLLKEQVADDMVEFDLHSLQALTPEQRQQYVLVVQDPFTSFYDAQVVADLGRLARKLNKIPVLLPFKPNGKPEYVSGFIDKFTKTATTTAAFLNQVGLLNIPMVGVDASLVLCYRDEYKKVLGDARGDFKVLTVHEWLVDIPASEWPKATSSSSMPKALFAHCTEKTALPKTEQQWQQIFAHVQQSVDIVKVGCCGMAGTYGHEAQNLDNSLGIYALSWQQAVGRYQPEQIMASGYSCRSQVNRVDGVKSRHPLQHLLALLDQSSADI
jgi:FAD/FMN-containing dehydrogenase/Fe-S oxidoreductase